MPQNLHCGWVCLFAEATSICCHILNAKWRRANTNHGKATGLNRNLHHLPAVSQQWLCMTCHHRPQSFALHRLKLPWPEIGSMYQGARPMECLNRSNKYSTFHCRYVLWNGHHAASLMKADMSTTLFILQS